MICVDAPRLFRRRRHHHLCLSHATMRIHFSLIAGISGNKGNESTASYGLIHQELIEASLVSSADRVGVVVECADLCAFKCSCDTFFKKLLSGSNFAVCVEKWTGRKYAMKVQSLGEIAHVFCSLGPARVYQLACVSILNLTWLFVMKDAAISAGFFGKKGLFSYSIPLPACRRLLRVHAHVWVCVL